MASIPEFLTQALQAQYGETLAAQILALGEPELAGRLEAEKHNMARQVLQKDAEIQEKVAAL